MMGRAKGGNPYRLYCLECEKFGAGVSKQFFKTHLRPHVLPKNAPLEDSDSVIPLHEWDNPDYFEDLAERSRVLAERDPNDSRPFLATEKNTFYCPDCEAFQIGQPAECTNCERGFIWTHE
jgi:hypothetical protein